MRERTSIAVLRMAVAVAAVTSVAPALAQQGEQQQSRLLPRELSSYRGLDQVELQYDSVRIEGSTFFLEGEVDLLDRGHGIRLLADVLRFDVEDFSFEATGNVSFEQGELLLNGTAMRGDLDDGALEMEGAKGVAPGPFYVRARRIVQIEPGKFRVEGGIVSPCNQTTPIWEFRSGSMTFKPGKYVTMAWPNLRVKSLPIFGLPYVYWPLQDQDRQTGLLIPSIGRSSRKGFMVSPAFFWAISRSADLTLAYEYFAKAGSGFAGEFRHAFGEGTNGSLRAYWYPGNNPTDEQLAAGAIKFDSGYTIKGSHVQALPGRFTLRAQADFLSSTQFARSFLDDVDQFLQRQSSLSGELSRSWGSHTLSLTAESRERFENDRLSTVGRKLPMLRYSLRSTQIAGPLYLSGQASAANLQKQQVNRRANDEVVNGGSYRRFDAFPDASLQVTQIPWLTFNPFFRWRSTWWSHSLRQQDFRFRDVSILRHYYETGIDVVGPSVFKIFETPGSEYSPRLKHLIQPRVRYTRSNQLDIPNVDRIIQFDEIDGSVFDNQSMSAEVTTRLFSQRFLSPNDPQRQVWQTMELTFGRNFDLTPRPPEFQDLGIPRIRVPYYLSALVTPTPALYVRGDMRFTTGFKPAGYSLSVRANASTLGGGLTWFRGVIDYLDPEDLTSVLVATVSDTLRADARADIFGRALSLGGYVDMDMFRNQLQSVGGNVKWNLQCCSIGLDIRRLNFSSRQETQFAFVLELAQVGTLGFDNQRK